jgi:MraZ protein
MRVMGTYRPKLDEKGRLFLPAKFRAALAEGVVVTQGQENCLYVWPPAVFDREIEALDRPLSSRAGRSLARMFYSSGEDLMPDKQGRIAVPVTLREYAGLEKDVVVIGVRDRLEIWNPARWEEYQAAESERFAVLDDDDE